MGKMETMRNQLLHDIEKLPEEFIKELLDYADYLVIKSRKLNKINNNKKSKWFFDIITRKCFQSKC